MDHWFVLTLCLILGNHLLLANVAPQDKTAVYSYNTVVLSGSPELAQQYSTVGIKCVVKVGAVSYNEIVIQITDVWVGKANEILNRISPDEIPLSYKKSEAYLANLTRPYQVKFNHDGLIESIQYDQQDNEWSRNMKTGLATMFQIKKMSPSIPARQPGEEPVMGVSEIIEPTFSGVCPVIYDYQPWKWESKGFELNITKTIDYNDCNEYAVPYYAMSTHRSFKCQDCEESPNPLTSNVNYKYNIVVDEKNNYLVQHAIADGIVKFTPWGSKADAMTVIHNRTLTLNGWSASNPPTLYSSNLDVVSPVSDLYTKVEEIRSQRDLDVPITYYQLFEKKENFVQEIRHGIKKMVELMIKDPTQLQLEVILGQIPVVQRAMFTVTFTQLQELAQEFSSTSTQENKIARKLFLDLVAITSSNPCIKFLLHASTNKMVTVEETVSFLPTISGHVLNPSVALMDYVLEFCNSRNVAENATLWDTCFLTFGSMVAKTCAGGPYQLPKGPGTYCPKNKVAQYVDFVRRHLETLQEEQRSIPLIISLGNMAVPEILPVLQPFFTRRYPTSLRVKAIYALIPLAKLNPQQVRLHLVNLFFNTEEETKVRIAAFRVLQASLPSRTMYEKIATSLQYDNDYTLSAFVYSSLKALANTTHPCFKSTASHAAFALKLIDETSDTSAWIASQQITEGEIEFLDVDSFSRWTSIGDAGSLTPSSFSSQLENFVAGVTTNLYQMTLYGHNTGYLVEKILGPSALFSNETLMERIENLGKAMENIGQEKIMEMLGAKSQDEPVFWANIWTRLMDFQQRHNHIGKHALKQIAQALTSPSRQINFWWQRSLMPLQVYVLMPIDCGHNVELSVHFPVQIGLKVEAERQESSRTDRDIKLNVKVHFAGKTVAKLGVWMPSEEATIGVGYETALIVNPSFAGHVKLSWRDTDVAVSIKSHPDKNTSGNKEIVHFHTYPYTLIEKGYEFRPSTHYAEFIRTMVPKQYEFPLIGESVYLQVTHEDYWDDWGSLYTHYTKNSVHGISSFWWMTSQAHMREYRVVWKNLPLPEFQFKLNWDYQAAESDPEKRYRNFWYVLWKNVAGWSDVPLDCRYESGENLASSEERFSSSDEFKSDERSSSSESGEGKFLDAIKQAYNATKKYGMHVVDKISHYMKDDVVVEEGRLGEGVVKYEIKAEFKLKGQSWVNGYRTQWVLKKYRKDLRNTVEWHVAPIGDEQEKKHRLCVTVESVDERPLCFFGKRIPDMSKARLTTEASIIWGRTCPEPEETLRVRIEAKKSRQQLEPNEEDQPWFYEQCKKDMKLKRPMSSACVEKAKDLAKLSRIEMVVKCTKCAPSNVTEVVRDWVVNQWYPQLTRDPWAKNENKQMKVVVQFRPYIPVMDVYVERPQETLNFKQVFYGDWTPYIQRPSISMPRTQRVLDYYSDNTVTPTCVVGSNYVDNFNNITYNFRQRPGCEFLLSADSSPANLFSVLTRRHSLGMKILTVYVLTNKIEINPQLTNDVVINKRGYSMKDRSILYIKDANSGPQLIATVVKTGNLYKVIMTFNRISVLFDGEYTQIKTSNLWRHKLRGICGEFNPQDRNRFKGPRKCVYSNADDFAQTYALPGNSCPRSRPLGKMTCDGDSLIVLSRSADSCMEYKPLVTKLEHNLTCVSLEMVKMCREECVGQEHSSKLVPFHCVSGEEDDSPQMEGLRRIYEAIEKGDLSPLEYKQPKDGIPSGMGKLLVNYAAPSYCSNKELPEE